MIKKCSFCQNTYEAKREHSRFCSKNCNNKEKQAKLLATGKCLRCCTKDARPGRRHCISCAAKFCLEQKRNQEKWKDEAFAAYGGAKCVCCGETEKAFLVFDHINDDGAEHRRSVFGRRDIGGAHIALWAKKNGYPPMFQILCHNCNFGKQRPGGCPCKKKLQGPPE